MKSIDRLSFVMSSSSAVTRTIGKPSEEATLQGDQFENWNHWIAKALYELADTERLAETVLRALASLAPVASCYAIHHSITDGTRVIASLPVDSVPAFAIFPIDPAPNEHEITSGCFRSEEEHPGFETNRRYQKMCHEGDFVDEILHVTPLPSSGHIFLGVVRSKSEGCFLDEELSLHQAVQPMIDFLSLRIAQVSTTSGVRVSEDITGPLQDALQCFAKEALTAREHQVMVLLIKGYDVRAAGKELGIAPDTVRSHRKNLYAKTATNSHGELFFKFLEFVRSGRFKKS